MLLAHRRLIEHGLRLETDFDSSRLNAVIGRVDQNPSPLFEFDQRRRDGKKSSKPTTPVCGSPARCATACKKLPELRKRVLQAHLSWILLDRQIDKIDTGVKATKCPLTKRVTKQQSARRDRGACSISAPSGSFQTRRLVLHESSRSHESSRFESCRQSPIFKQEQRRKQHERKPQASTALFRGPRFLVGVGVMVWGGVCGAGVRGVGEWVWGCGGMGGWVWGWGWGCGWGVCVCVYVSF